MKYGFGVDLGGTAVKLAFFDAQGTLLDKWAIPTAREDAGCRILPDIAASITAYLAEKQLSRDQLLGIGIGIPGPVLPDGSVSTCVNLGWQHVHVEKTLSRLTGLPVKALNDASAAALGECLKGGAAGCRNMILITLGTGLGGGVIVDGKVVPGAHGAGGEIGHITLEQEETECCSCGRRGCAEQYCSATGIVRLMKKALKNGTSCLSGKTELTCKDVFDAANAGDSLANGVLQRVYGYLGQLLAVLSCVADPEIFILGGGVSNAGQPLLEGVQAAYAGRCFRPTEKTKIALAALGNDAGIYGAFLNLLGG